MQKLLKRENEYFKNLIRDPEALAYLGISMTCLFTSVVLFFAR